MMQTLALTGWGFSNYERRGSKNLDVMKGLNEKNSVS